MGKRVNYEIAGEDGAVGIVLYSNSSHPDIDAEALFAEYLAETTPLSKGVRSLLGLEYPSTEGNNREGAPIFTIDLEPGDREYVLRAVVTSMFEGHPTKPIRFERDYGDGRVVHLGEGFEVDVHRPDVLSPGP